MMLSYLYKLVESSLVFLTTNLNKNEQGELYGKKRSNRVFR